MKCNLGGIPWITTMPSQSDSNQSRTVYSQLRYGVSWKFFRENFYHISSESLWCVLFKKFWFQFFRWPFVTLRGHERSNFQKFAPTALNINLRVNFVLGANRKLGMANSKMKSDLTFDLCFKVKCRSRKVKLWQNDRKLPLSFIILPIYRKFTTVYILSA